MHEIEEYVLLRRTPMFILIFLLLLDQPTCSRQDQSILLAQAYHTKGRRMRIEYSTCETHYNAKH